MDDPVSIDRNGAEAMAVDRRRRHLKEHPGDLKAEDIRFARLVIHLEKQVLEEGVTAVAGTVFDMNVPPAPSCPDGHEVREFTWDGDAVTCVLWCPTCGALALIDNERDRSIVEGWYRVQPSLKSI